MMQNEETEKGEWVNFSSSSEEVRPTYVYPCNFCRRKFYSSQALGGHQNAHKRERGLLRHYRIPIVPRSLGPHPHSIPPHQSRLTDITGPVATYSERCTSFRSGWQWQQPTAAMWPGSFGFGDQQSWPGEIQREDELDLELKL